MSFRGVIFTIPHVVLLIAEVTLKNENQEIFSNVIRFFGVKTYFFTFTADDLRQWSLKITKCGGKEKR